VLVRSIPHLITVRIPVSITPVVGMYCGMLSPPILMSEVIPPAQIVDMVVVDVIAEGGGLILTCHLVAREKTDGLTILHPMRFSQDVR